MRTILATLLPLCLLLSTFTTAQHKSLTKSLSQFSKSLYENVNANADENVIISPLSIQTALAFLYMGASGQTAQYLAAGLNLNHLSRDDISHQFGNLMKSFENSRILNIANKLYVMQGKQIKPEFEEAAAQFRSESQSLNFAAAQDAAATINAWVESKTNNKIHDLISPDSLSGDTRLVLVNAVYFQGNWVHQFYERFTESSDFWINDVEKVKVDAMFNKDVYQYGELDNLDARAIRMKYKDSNMSMVIILPNQRNGLAQLERDLVNYSFKGVLAQLTHEDVSLTLPKFKVSFEISLKDTLTKMGMGNMFSDNAEFGNLLQSKEALKVSDVVHKAFIEVNERGTEAAASTGLKIQALMYTAPLFFNINHPFKYYLLNGNDVVFVGKFVKPSKTN